MKRSNFILLLVFCLINIHAQELPIKVGAECVSEYFPLLKGKRIAVFCNHTSMAGNEYLVDLLVRSGFNVSIIFAPEHGFRGGADAGERVNDEIDPKTGISIFSLYKSKTGRPRKEQMQKFDILIADIQDVGLRYYTYYISMYKLMDACAEYKKHMILLDRPNPNGFYVDGPILDMKYKSGVGYLPIPIVHGMTLGELAQMINGELWLPKNRKCKLTVIKCKNYTHHTLYQLPIAPSPNLPNMKSIYLYASTCFFEGTRVSLGRGTPFPFQVYGHPNMTANFSFTPKSITGAKNPPLKNKKCYGVDLRSIPDEQIREEGINLNYLIDAYNNLNIGTDFFTPFILNLTGVDYIREMIIKGKTASEIKAVWKDDVENFKLKRKPYLLYEE